MTALPIELPVGFIPLVQVGDRVTVGQVIAKKDAPQDEIVNILQSLNISRRLAKKVLKKSPGERINPGDIIAVKKNFFGKVLGTITTQISGTVIRYERDTGNLVVRTDIETSELEFISPVAGIVSLCNNKEIVIQTQNAFISVGVAIGNAGEGSLLVLKESFEEEGSDNTLFYLDSRAEGKIVLVKTLTRDLIIKGDSIGAVGFLGTAISNEDIAYLEQKQLQIPVVEITKELVSQIYPWENKKIKIETKTKAIILSE